MDELKGLDEKMFALQGDIMELGVLKKDMANDHLGARYLSFTAIQLALLPLWRKYRLLVRFDDEYTLESTKVTLSVKDLDNGEIECHTYEVAISDRPRVSRVQCHGADESYMKRYLLKTAFWIVDSEDDKNESYLAPRESPAATTSRADPPPKDPDRDTPDGAAIKMHLESPLFKDHQEDAGKFRNDAAEAWKAKDANALNIVRTEIERFMAVIASGRK